jgi:hypothetical protein
VYFRITHPADQVAEAQRVDQGNDLANLNWNRFWNRELLFLQPQRRIRRVGLSLFKMHVSLAFSDYWVGLLVRLLKNTWSRQKTPTATA